MDYIFYLVSITLAMVLMLTVFVGGIFAYAALDYMRLVKSDRQRCTEEEAIECKGTDEAKVPEDAGPSPTKSLGLVKSEDLRKRFCMIALYDSLVRMEVAPDKISMLTSLKDWYEEYTHVTDTRILEFEDLLYNSPNKIAEEYIPDLVFRALVSEQDSKALLEDTFIADLFLLAKEEKK